MGHFYYLGMLKLIYFKWIFWIHSESIIKLLRIKFLVPFEIAKKEWGWSLIQDLIALLLSDFQWEYHINLTFLEVNFWKNISGEDILSYILLSSLMYCSEDVSRLTSGQHALKKANKLVFHLFFIRKLTNLNLFFLFNILLLKFDCKREYDIVFNMNVLKECINKVVDLLIN